MVSRTISSRIAPSILASLLLLLSSAAGAQELQSRGPLQETYRDKVPVGGATLVGAIALSEGQAVAHERLRVLLPLTGQYDLCVELRSRDGRYLGSTEFVAGNKPTGLYRLPWDTGHAAALKNYDVRDLAVRAELKTTCSPAEKANSLVVAAWGDIAAEQDVLFLLNVGAVDQIGLGTTDGSIHSSCEQFDSGHSVAYNTACKIRLQRGQTYQMRLVTWYFEEPTFREFTVAFP